MRHRVKRIDLTALTEERAMEEFQRLVQVFPGCLYNLWSEAAEQRRILLAVLALALIAAPVLGHGVPLRGFLDHPIVASFSNLDDIGEDPPTGIGTGPCTGSSPQVAEQFRTVADEATLYQCADFDGGGDFEWTAIGSVGGGGDLTAGSVVFADGSDFAEDNTNFFWDDTNNRLGLGDTTPAAIVDVDGNASADDLLDLTAFGGARALVVGDDGGIGMGTATPDGTLHVFAASAGTVAASAVADDFVVEGGNPSGMSILSAGDSNLFFGTHLDPDGVFFSYRPSTGLFQFGGFSAGVEVAIMVGSASQAIRIDASKNTNMFGKFSGVNQAVTLGSAVTTYAETSNFTTLTGDVGANTLATITGGVAGQVLRILCVDGLVTITDTDAHTADTVDLSAAFTCADDTILSLLSDGTSWYETSRSVN